MERNVIESVKNNIFGTLNVVEACEKYGVKRFTMISTDKAVNPTNVMVHGNHLRKNKEIGGNSNRNVIKIWYHGVNQAREVAK